MTTSNDMDIHTRYLQGHAPLSADRFYRNLAPIRKATKANVTPAPARLWIVKLRIWPKVSPQTQRPTIDLNATCI